METSVIVDRIKERMGIEHLNAMQRAMAETKARRIVLLAPTGSGKTVAFALRLLRALHPSRGTVQAVVLAPSRELVLQIADVVRPLAAGLKTVAFYGGHSMVDETKALSPVPDIIVATPGRMLDHIMRSQIELSSVTALVIDEYDKALELGFHDQMKRIAKRIVHPDLIMLTSATELEEMPKFLPMEDAETFNFGHAKNARSRLQTVRVDSPERDKLNTVRDLLAGFNPSERTMVFVNHRESAERLYNALKREGFPVGLYHGGLEQRLRQLAVDKFNNGTTPILISTDLGARGLDIADVANVVHYHMPLTPETWTHRNGRTARQGADGTAYIVVSEGDNIPDGVDWQRTFTPKPAELTRRDMPPATATIHFNAGKKEKISRGDIVGYLIKQGGLKADEIGKITVNDHDAIAAVPAASLPELLDRLAPHKLKNTRVRVTEI